MRKGKCLGVYGAMMIWILFTLLTVAAALTVLVPPLRQREAVTVPGGVTLDEAVYKQQLKEVDRDLASGSIDTGAAEAARTEIARRLLAAHRAAGKVVEAPKSRGMLRVTQIGAVLFLPIVAFGFYSMIGSPQYPDQPLAKRLAASPEEQSVDLLVVQMEHHLADVPNDGRGWEVIAPIYLHLGRADQAAHAYQKAIDLLGPSVDRETSYGEALTMKNNGLITKEAGDAFDRALKIDPKDAKARFFHALALTQDGDKEKAIAAWQDLLKDAKGGEPWVGPAQQQLAALTEAPSAGPTDDQMRDADSMSPDQRQQMIQGMVKGLEKRLESDGGTAQDWMRLIRSYLVLGNEKKAKEAFTKAQANLSTDQNALKTLMDQAKAVGLKP